MKKNLAWLVLAGLILICCLWACIVFNWLSINEMLFQNTKCGLPYKGFSETDILGTWQAWRPGNTDTIIIRADKKYKQVVKIQSPLINFESDWQTWSLVYSKTGTPYLYLENFHLCGAEPEIFDCQVSGGGARKWLDVCSNDQWVTMADNGILAVVNGSTGKESSRDEIILILFPLSSENPWGYHLSKP